MTSDQQIHDAVDGETVDYLPALTVAEDDAIARTNSPGQVVAWAFIAFVIVLTAIAGQAIAR